MSEMVSPHISLAEYACHCKFCGNSLPPDFKRDEDGEWPTIFEALFSRFEGIREIYGQSIPVTGYRCPRHELNVSGKTISVHIFGLALDCTGDVDRLSSIVEENYPELRMGTYADGHIHIDVGYLIHPRYSVDLAEGARWKA